jgi:hypothetical protein
MSCDGIKMGSAYNCDNPLVAGVNQRLILVNKADWDEGVKTFGTPTSLLTNIVLATGKQGWAFEGVRQSTKPQSAYVPGTTSIGYDHQVDYIVFDTTQEQKDNLEGLGVKKVVAVVQNINAIGNGNSVFEVYGSAVGLELITNIRINDDQETSGGYAISLKTGDAGGKEPKLPMSWWDADFNTTKALVDALLIPAI